jgi:hypothetical protein
MAMLITAPQQITEAFLLNGHRVASKEQKLKNLLNIS